MNSGWLCRSSAKHPCNWCGSEGLSSLACQTVQRFRPSCAATFSSRPDTGAPFLTVGKHIQIHHIEGYAVQPEHTFDDLIALCANCHQRVTNGQIDRKAVRQIKANLSVLSHRYGDLERRYLETVATAGGRAGTYVSMQIGFELLMKNLLDDGFVTYKKHVYARMTGGLAVPAFEDGTSIYQLTPKGEEFVRHWLAADSLE